MAPLPSPEPFELLDTVEVVDARKLRFERNRIKLPMGVEATFGMIRHPGASLAVPITNDGQVVLLRQYRFAVQPACSNSLPARLKMAKIHWNRCSGSWGRKPATALRSGMCWGRCFLALVIPMK